MNSLLPFSLIIYIFSFSFINVSAKEEHLDMAIFSSVISIADIFRNLKVSTDILPQLSKKAIEKAKNYLNKRVSEQNVHKEEEDPNICSDDNKLIHSKVAAYENMLRDSDAKDFGQEFLYMYLSHYIDIPPEYLGGCSKNDEEPYYANWITNDDRAVYDSFLKTIRAIEIVEVIRNTISDITSILDSLDVVLEYYYLSESAKNTKVKIEQLIKEGSLELTSGKTVKEIFEENKDILMEYFENTELPEEVIIDKVKENIGRDVISKDLGKSILDSIDAYVALSVGDISLFSAVKTMIDVPLQIFTTLAPKAAVAGMLYSLSGRLAGRVERIIELDDW